MLKKLKLHNFRNHSDFETELGQTTVFIGANGAGKSNILEAISLLSFCRSFRNDDKKSLVKFGADFARITGDSAEIFLQRNPSFIFQVKESGLVKRQADYIGQRRSVVFSPETMSIVTGSPRQRRKFLDIMISQANRQYLRSLVQYEKIRLERNSLLQRVRTNQAGEGELEFWDKELVSEGSVIIALRHDAVATLNSRLSEIYSQISGRSDKLELDYVSNAKEDFRGALKNQRRREIMSGHTLVGPHRDDLVFQLNMVDMANFASRGEIRSAVLALKIVELEYLTENENIQPILLLDDVFSEFDKKRREHLCAVIEKHQTVITTTEQEYLSACLLGLAKIIEI